MSERDILNAQLREMFPMIPTRVVTGIRIGAARANGNRALSLGDMLEWIRTAPDGEILDTPYLGNVALTEIHAARATMDYGDVGGCNWVGEGIPA